MTENICSQSDVVQQNALISELLGLFLQEHSRSQFMQECLHRIRRWAVISAAGIRVLDTLGNIPYQSQSGLDQQFMDSEQWLSTLSDNCVCIRVVQGQIEPQETQYCPPRGSFVCNDTLAFIQNLSEDEKKRYRGVCITLGYLSLAVIPIRYGSNTLGVLHLVDTHKNAFSDSSIQFLESTVASLLGEGIYRYTIKEHLQHTLEIQTALTSLLKHSLQDLSLDNLLNITLDLIHSCQPLSGEIKSAVYLSDDEGASLNLAAWRNFDEIYLFRCSHILKGHCACGQAAEKQEPVVLESDLCQKGEGSPLAVPIIYQKIVVGVICLYFPSVLHRDQRQVQFLTAIADTLAGIIWRKRSERILRRLSLRMVSVQEEERRHIALELHDQIGQMLTGLKLMIGQALRSNPGGGHEALKEAQNAVTELIVKVREMSLDLRPSMLDDLGLLPALIWHFQRSKTQSNLNVDFRHSGLEATIHKDVAIAAYRIVQEALTNVMRYAGVNNVLVEIWTELEILYIRIEDQGRGFKPEEVVPGSSIGLQSMRERAMLLGGSLTVESAPGLGTVVFAQLPLTIRSENVTISGNPVTT